MHRRVEDQQLAYYKQAASADYWDDVWAKNVTPGLYTQAREGELGYYETVFLHYLPKEGWVIEVGPGLGQFVLALLQLGYDAECIGWGAETVQLVKTMMTDLPVRQGDVNKLDVPDKYYATYISLRVVEHIQECPKAIWKKPGVFWRTFISMPHFHPLRRLKANSGMHSYDADGLGFYQYAFRQNEFKSILQKYGFGVIEIMPFDGYKGVKGEVARLLRLFDLPRIGWRIRCFFQRSKWIEKYFGHTTMFVCCKV